MKKKLYSAYFACLGTVLALFPNIRLGAQVQPLVGDLIISEFMANPSAVSDTKGEWLEILNVSEHILVLNGLEIKDDGSNKSKIEGDQDILLDPGRCFLMARNSLSDENGGLQPDYVYSNFTLGNTEDEIILLLPDGTILDQIRYNSEWDIEKGVSLELDPSFKNPNSNDKSQWHLAKEAYGLGDLGSPGRPNSSSLGINLSYKLDRMEVYPNPCFGILNVDLQFSENANAYVSMVNLVGQEIPIFECQDSRDVFLTIDTDMFEKGVWLVRVEADGAYEIKKVIIF